MPLIISENTTWNDGESVSLTGDIQIANGVTLEIEPGVKIYGNGYEITAFGTLDVGRSNSEKSVEFFDTHFQFGNNFDNPGKISIQNANIRDGSFLNASGSARYGSFDIHDSTFNGVDGFYIWYPTSESELSGNSFINSKGLSIGTNFGDTVTIENNAFLNPKPAFNGQAVIVSWASYGADDNIRVINNTFYEGPTYILENADKYGSSAIYANGNFIEAAIGRDGEDFVLDSQDSLTRSSDISLGDEATSPHPDTPLINRAPSGTVSIAGTAKEGKELSADTSGITDPDALGDFTYQWYRDEIKLSGARSSSYELTSDDVGSKMSVHVTYEDGFGFVETLKSSPGDTVSTPNYLPTGAVSVNGDAMQGETLTVDTATLADADGLGELSYQWLRDGAEIADATSVSYDLAQADVDSEISVIVSYTDGYGTDESITSAVTAPISNVNDLPSGAVSVNGDAMQGETLTVDTATLADADGLGELSYQWLRDAAEITDATSDSYDLAQADVGNRISVVVSYTDGYGTDESITSATTPPIKGDLKIFGDSKENELSGAGFNDRLSGRGGDDILKGYKGNDLLLGGNGADTLLGGAGTDVLKGGTGDDLLEGQGGGDHLFGLGGNDALFGGNGADTLSGGRGRDLVHGQKGNDILAGGGGRDTFAFNRGDGSDAITDFDLGIDHIQIGRGASRFGQLDFEQVGDDALVSFRNVEITVENTAVDDLAISDHFLFV